MQQIFLHGITVVEFLRQVSELIDNKLAQNSTLQPTSSSPKYLSREEVSQTLKISLVTLHAWTKKGVLKSYKIGARVLYKQEDIDQALAKNLTKIKSI